VLKISSAVARILLWLISGWIIFESIRELNKFFSLSLNPNFAIVPTALAYIFHEFAIRRWKVDGEGRLRNRMINPKFDRAFYLIAWIIFLCFLFVVSILWIGVIYKQAATSYDRYDAPMK
jgi:hypothetical protein